MACWSHKYCRCCSRSEDKVPQGLCHQVAWIRPLTRRPFRQVHSLSAVLLINPGIHVCVLGLNFGQLLLAVEFWWSDFTWPYPGWVIKLPWIRQRWLQPWDGLKRLYSCSPCMWHKVCATQEEQRLTPAPSPPPTSKSPPGLRKSSKRLSVIWLYFIQISPPHPPASKPTAMSFLVNFYNLP